MRLTGAEGGAPPPGAEGIAEEVSLAPGDVPARIAGLARQAQTAYDRAIAAQRRGDWAAYGEALDELGRILGRMDQE